MHDRLGRMGQANERVLVDPGAPLKAKKLQIFAAHPRLQLFPGNSIAVVECPALPE